MASILNDIGSVFSRKNNTVLKLVLINVFVFLIVQIFSFFFSFSETTKSFSLVLVDQLRLSAPIISFLQHPWTLITYSFVHRDIIHLLFNMLSLFWFGLIIEDLIGSRKILMIYLLGGIVSGILYISIYNALALAPNTLAVRNVSPSIEGASAAVMAVMFATITLAPEYEFFFFQRFAVKLSYIAWVILLLSCLNQNPSVGISHAIGAFVGYLYIKLLRMGIDLASPIEKISDWWAGIWQTKPKQNFNKNERKYSKSTVYSSSSSNKSLLNTEYFPNQEEVDAILDKIGKSGYESLSKDEKETLYRASQKKD